jgi:hypothetical protein
MGHKGFKYGSKDRKGQRFPLKLPVPSNNPIVIDEKFEEWYIKVKPCVVGVRAIKGLFRDCWIAAQKEKNIT